MSSSYFRSCNVDCEYSQTVYCYTDETLCTTCLLKSLVQKQRLIILFHDQLFHGTSNKIIYFSLNHFLRLYYQFTKNIIKEKNICVFVICSLLEWKLRETFLISNL